MRSYLSFTLIALSFALSQTVNSRKSINSKCNSNISTFGDSTLLYSLKDVNIKRYIGLPVDSFLIEKSISKYQSYSFMEEPPRLMLNYSKNLWIDIFVSDIFYSTNPNDPSKWDFSKFRTQKIQEIRIVYQRETIKKARL